MKGQDEADVIGLTGGHPVLWMAWLRPLSLIKRLKTRWNHFKRCSVPQTSVDTTRTELNKPIGQAGTNPTRHRTLLSTRASNSPGPQCLVRARSIKAAACGGLRRANPTDVILCVFPQQRLSETETEQKEAWELGPSQSPFLWQQWCCCCFPKRILPCSLPIVFVWSAVLTAVPFGQWSAWAFWENPQGWTSERMCGPENSASFP